MRYQQFFTALVHLLYSISKSDHLVHLVEVQEILEIINKDIPNIFPQIPDSFVKLNNQIALEEFKKLYNNQITEEEAYSVFIQFYEKHKSEFNIDINLLCYQLAAKVAYSYKGVNEEEKNFLARLKHDLEVE